MRYDPFQIVINYRKLRYRIKVEHTPGAAVDTYRLLGKRKFVELQTNQPLMKRLNRKTPHFWNVTTGHVESKYVLEQMTAAIEKHWEMVKPAPREY